MEVGDYVRTKNFTFQPSQIAKIKRMEKDKGYKNQYYIELDHNLIHNFKFHIYEEDIDKSSPNIIDLIKKGDYVNGERVIGFGKFIYDDRTEEITSLTLDATVSCLPEDIKTIVTKEQFKGCEYKL